MLLTCRIAHERVLLSHFQEWHMVLNRGLGIPRLPGESVDDSLARWENAAGAFDARLEAAGVRDRPVRDWPLDLRAEVEESWERIFDRANYGLHECWQATVHVLYAEDVVDARANSPNE